MVTFNSNSSIEMLNNLETIKMLEPGLLPDSLLVAITKDIFSLRIIWWEERLLHLPV